MTLEFSTDIPCPATIIPVIDKMHDKLIKAAENNQYLLPLWAALSIGERLLNKYYSLTDDSEIYHIAMSKFHFLFPTFFVFIINFSS